MPLHINVCLVPGLSGRLTEVRRCRVDRGIVTKLASQNCM